MKKETTEGLVSRTDFNANAVDMESIAKSIIYNVDEHSFTSLPISGQSLHSSMQSLHSSLKSLQVSGTSLKSLNSEHEKDQERMHSLKSLHSENEKDQEERMQSLKSITSENEEDQETFQSIKPENDNHDGKVVEQVLKQKEKICGAQSVMFSLLSITCALTVMIIWYFNLEDNQTNKDIPSDQIVRQVSNNSCPYWHITGDGYCDDEANIEECGYDFKDCCQMESDRTLCQDCFCYISETKEILDEYMNMDYEYTLDLANWGNGHCDLYHNNPEHFFDVGDCCLEHLSCQIDGQCVDCPANPCIESNVFCVPEELGDGICQDHNNSPFCDYDLGDCCSVMEQFECRQCLCRDIAITIGDNSWLGNYPNNYLPLFEMHG